MTDEKLASLDGRIAMLEVLTANILAHFCIQFDQPIPLAAHVLDHTERSLLRAKEVAPEAGIASAKAALASYARLSEATLMMINKLAPPLGNG